MRIWSDTLTREDFRAAIQNAPRGVEIYELSGPLKARKRSQRYELFLEGNSPYAGQHSGSGHAATWDEWGLVLHELFCRDPEMVASHYSNRESFRRQTQEQRDHVLNVPYYRETPHGRAAAKRFKAPWLNKDGSFNISP